MAATSPGRPLELLYYCPISSGGIADYARVQAAAIAEAGVDVRLVTPVSETMPRTGVSPAGFLEDESRAIEGSTRILRQMRRSVLIRGNVVRLKAYILKHRIRHVMLASYSEYAAPLWSYQLQGLVNAGVRFSAMLHDPVRDYVVGPAWWHKWSVRCGYSFLADVFVHEEGDRVEAGIPDHVQITVVPHGPSDFPPPAESRADVRLRLGIPKRAK